MLPSMYFWCMLQKLPFDALCRSNIWRAMQTFLFINCCICACLNGRAIKLAIMSAGCPRFSLLINSWITCTFFCLLRTYVIRSRKKEGWRQLWFCFGSFETFISLLIVYIPTPTPLPHLHPTFMLLIWIVYIQVVCRKNFFLPLIPPTVTICNLKNMTSAVSLLRPHVRPAYI